MVRRFLIGCSLSLFLLLVCACQSKPAVTEKPSIQIHEAQPQAVQEPPAKRKRFRMDADGDGDIDLDDWAHLILYFTDPTEESVAQRNRLLECVRSKQAKEDQGPAGERARVPGGE